MKVFHTIDHNNFVLYASHVYDNPCCENVEEFYQDLNRIKYLKRLLNRYEDEGLLRERLILNHITVIYNVFGIEGAHKMLFFRIERSKWSYLKTFLVYLGYLEDGSLPTIPIDPKISKALREI